MASAITHFVVGAALALPALRSASITQTLPAWAVPLSAGMLAIGPDLDTYLMSALELPYHSVLGHRGVFHSAVFLIVANALLAALVARGSWGAAAKLAALWAGCALTHPLLDMLTDGDWVSCSGSPFRSSACS